MKSQINWDQHINAWRESGVNKAEYCRQNGLNPQIFYFKTRKAREASERRDKVFFELPSHVTEYASRQAPAFELHLSFPFQFRFRINLDFGREK